MKPLNSKVYFEILSDDKQPKKSVFIPDAEMLKLAEVIDVGESVTKVKKEDIITIYVTAISMLTSTTGFCAEREIIFINSYPQENKIHINSQVKQELTVFKKANVLASSSPDIEAKETIYYKDGQTHILPDGSEIISESQVYYKD